MTGKTVLFAWELGDGLGHVSRMLPLAEQLKDRGHHCIFAVRNPETTHKAISTHGFSVLQAPITVPRTDYDGPLFIGAYGDVLETVGYNDNGRLTAMVAAWDALFEIAKPDLIVADYAPTAQLASLGDIPTVTIGDWFTQPPSGLTEFPLLRHTGRRFDEQGLLETVRDVQIHRDRKTPEHLPNMLTCARTFIITLPELDQYAALRKSPVVGPLKPLPEPVNDLPPEQDYFAYLSLGFKHTEKVLENLVDSRFKGSLFLRDGKAAQKEAWRGRGLHIHDSPQNMTEMAKKSAIIIHHGGLGTIEAGLALGRPQLTVPRHLEQAVNSKMIGDMGLAAGMKLAGQFSEGQFGEALSYTLSTDRLHINAANKARQLTERGPFNGLEQIVEFCLTTLEANR